MSAPHIENLCLVKHLRHTLLGHEVDVFLIVSYRERMEEGGHAKEGKMDGQTWDVPPAGATPQNALHGVTQ